MRYEKRYTIQDKSQYEIWSISDSGKAKKISEQQDTYQVWLASQHSEINPQTHESVMVDNTPTEVDYVEQSRVDLYKDLPYEQKINLLCRNELIKLGYTDGLISVVVWNMSDEMKKKIENPSYTMNEQITIEYNQLKAAQEQIKAAVYAANSIL